MSLRRCFRNPPADRALFCRMVQDIAFFNARAYLGLEGSLGRGVEPAAA